MRRLMCGIAPAVFLALAGCDSGADPMESPANIQDGEAESVQAQLEDLPEGQRNAVFIRAIRDSEGDCQGVESSEPAGEHEGVPLWRARCTDGSSWTIAVTDNGTAQVINDAEAPFATSNKQGE